MQVKLLWGMFLILLISGCAEFRPFEDTRREAGQVAWVGQSTKDRVAICYNPLWSDMDEIQSMAEAGCQKTGRHAIYDDVEYFSCRFVNPSTAFYRCQ